MNILFICATNMQIIIALQAKLKLFYDDEVDIILCGRSVHFEDKAKGLQKTGLFRRVKYIEPQPKIASSYSTSKKIFDYFALLFNHNKYMRFLWKENFNYEQVYYYNMSLLVYASLDRITHETNSEKMTEIIRFEEGLFSCGWLPFSSPRWRRKIMYTLLKFKGKQDPLTDTHKFMCFYPELLGISLPEGKKEYSSVRIPALTSKCEVFLDNLNTIFDYDPSADSFPQKYVYFSTSADIDGHPVGETEIILKLAELVGKDNLLVKVHPRDERDVFERNGLPVSRNSSLPWEVIQLNHNFTNHIFVSLSSGSTVNVTAMKNENIPVFMLYPMVAGKNTYMDTILYANIGRTLNCLQSMGVCKSVKITGNLKDILQA